MTHHSIKRVPSPVPHRTVTNRPTIVHKFLVVLDFDQTIVEGNCGTAAQNVIRKRLGTSQSGKNSRGLTQSNIVTLLTTNGGVEADISKEIKRIKATENMLPFIRGLPKLDCLSIIVSDAHPFFIRTWLKSRGVFKVFANILGYQGDNVPKKPESTDQKDDRWCYFCSKYMCKGLLLKEFIRAQRQKGMEFKRVVYVGDGRNDFCPVLRLRGGDIVFARDGFALKSCILAREYDVNAVTYFWRSAEQIASILNVLNEDGVHHKSLKTPVGVF